MAAQQLDYVAFTGRHPFITDAVEHGFLPGVREDDSYRIDDYLNIDLAILFLDNHFHDPELDRPHTRFARRVIYDGLWASDPHLVPTTYRGRSRALRATDDRGVLRAHRPIEYAIEQTGIHEIVKSSDDITLKTQE